MREASALDHTMILGAWRMFGAVAPHVWRAILRAEDELSLSSAQRVARRTRRAALADGPAAFHEAQQTASHDVALPTIAEDVRDAMALGLRLALETTSRTFTSGSPIATASPSLSQRTLTGTRAECDGSPNSAPMSICATVTVGARLEPPTRKRAEVDALARDRTAMLRQTASGPPITPVV